MIILFLVIVAITVFMIGIAILGVLILHLISAKCPYCAQRPCKFIDTME